MASLKTASTSFSFFNNGAVVLFKDRKAGLKTKNEW